MTLSISKGKELEIQLLDEITNLEGQKQKVDGELKLTVKQTKQPSYEYPFISTQTKVNYCPREHQKLISDLPFLSLCRSGVHDEDPTCGWAIDEGGQRIPYSQGFCCKCNGIFSDSETSRSGSSCGLFDFSSSAHCLRRSPIWFSVSTILPPRLNMEIEINTEYDGNKAGVTLSPSQPVAVLRKGIEHSPLSLSATVIGQLQASVLPPSFESNYALLPSEPVDSPLVTNKNQYLALVPKNMVTLLGDECNKIGVSHATFSRQSERCNVAPSTCLRNQLCDLQLIDSQRVKEGLKAQYFIGFDQNIEMKEGDGREVLVYPVTEGIQNTLITIEVDAAQIRLVSNVSPGKLVNVVVHTFEAQSANGEMEIIVENLGSLDTTKTVTVVCSAQVVLVNPIQFRLKAQETETKLVQILTRNSAPQTHTCDVKLFSEQNQVEDNVTVEFDTTVTVLATPEKKTEEQDPEVTREDSQGSFDTGDLGGAFDDFLSGAFSSPLVIGSVIVVLGIIGLIAVVVILAVVFFCCVSTNSLPLFMSMFCAASRATNSTISKISSQNARITKRISEKSRKSRSGSRSKKHRSKRDDHWSSDDSDSPISNKKRKRSKKTSYRTPKAESRKRRVRKLSRKEANSKSRSPDPNMPQRKRRKISKEREKNKDSKGGLTRDTHREKTKKRKMRKESASGRTEISGKSPTILTKLPSVSSPETAPERSSRTTVSFPKRAPVYSDNCPKVLYKQLESWQNDHQLVYLSVHTDSIEYSKIFKDIVKNAPWSAWFALCGFIRVEDDTVLFEMGNSRYNYQWFGVQEGHLQQFEKPLSMDSSTEQIKLKLQMCQYHMHSSMVRGPVLNLMSRKHNFAIWERSQAQEERY